MIDSHFGINLNQQYQAGPEVFGSIFPVDFQQTDLDYMWDLGIRKVRVPLKQWGSRQIDIDWQRTAAIQTKAKGFQVSIGSGQHNSPGHRPKDWVDFYDFILNDEVPWLMEQDFDSNDVYMLGNESETSPLTDSFASVARTSNVVTCVYPYKHMMATGDTIETTILVLSVATGTKTVTVIDDYTFTFASVGADVSTILAPTITNNNFKYKGKTVMNAMKRLATLVRATGLVMKLSYSCAQGVTVNNGTPETDVFNISDFVSVGRGDFDYIDLNIYSDVATAPENGIRFFIAEVNVGYNGFGASHFRVTEWNLWHTNAQIPQPAGAATYWFMRRLEFMQNLGIDHFIFCYREHNNLLTLTQPYNTTEGQTWRDWWWTLIGGKQRQPTQEVVFGTATAVPSLRTSPLTLTDTRMAFNMGQYEQSGVFNSSRVNTYLTFLWNVGVRKLRIASGDPTFSSGVTACRNLALAAKAMGFYVIFVNSGQGSTDANWADQLDALRDFAVWADANDMDEINMFNELDYRQTVSAVLTNSVQKQIDIAVELIAAHPSLVISTAVAQSSLEYLGATGGWIARKDDVIAAGLKVCYNVYGDDGNFEQFQERIIDLQTAYPDLRISEWNVAAQWGSFPQPESAQNPRIDEKLDFLISRNLESYFFTFNWDQASDQFALKKADGSLRSWSEVLFTNPLPRSAAGSRPVASGRPTITIS
jgi:hypothetical protein